MPLTKKQAADALFISTRTLDRRMKNGTYKFTRTGEGQFAEITFNPADLGLPADSIAVQIAEAQHHKEITLPYQDDPTPTPNPNFVPDPMAKKQASDAAFAVAYLAGEATDSYGNTVGGINAKCPTIGVQCGVTKPVEMPVVADTQAHMDKALLSDHDSAGNPIDPEHKMGTREYEDVKANRPLTVGYTRSGITLAAGFTQEMYDAMMHKWGQQGGAPSESEQAAKVRQDRAAMLAAFRQRNTTTASRGLAK